MFLKSLQITGFKSFARPVRLDLVPGVTAVVGPNGSGKSNVVDAIRWVLGEQSLRALRGSKGDDVIFGGSAMRHALGMAEVVMVLDNADRRVELDVEEVAIGRRLYRSGEADYLVNRKRARLKDVLDVAAQAGLGPSSYCVVGQGAIDQLVMQRPQERRSLITDAADTRRFEMRLAEIEGDLDETQQHVLRLQAVVAELAPQRERLRGQAERAERHRAVREEVEGLARAWFGYAVPTAQRAQASAEARCDTLDATIAAAQERMATLRATRDQTQARGVGLKERASGLARELGEARGHREKLRVDSATATERLESSRQRLHAIDRDLTVGQQQLTPAREALEGSAQAAQQAQAALATSPVDLEALNAELAAAEAQVTARRRILTDAQNGAERTRRLLEDVNRHLVRLREEMATAAAARAGRRDREQDFATRIADLTAAGTALQTEIATARAATEDAGPQLAAARAEQDQARAALKAAEQAAREANRKLDGLLGEERAVGRLVEDASGGTTADRLIGRLRAPLRYQRAIAAAIGEAARYTVVDAQGVAWYAEPTGAGHHVLVPLVGPASRVDTAFRDWAAGTLGTWVSYVFATEALEPDTANELAARYLGKTIIVPSIGEARRAASMLAEANATGVDFAVATEDGQCLLSTGERVLRPDSAELRAIEARTRREALAAQVAAARAGSAEAERQHQEATRRDQTARDALRRLEEARNAGRQQLQRAEEQLAALNRDLQREQANLARLQASVVAAPDPAAVQRFDEERASLEQQIEQSVQQLRQLAEQLSESERQRDTSRAARVASGAERAVAMERAARLQDAMDRDAREVKRLEDRVTSLAAERERLETDVAGLDRHSASIKQVLGEALERITALERDEREARAAGNAHEASLEDLGQQERAVQTQLLELRGQESTVRTAIEHAKGELERLSVEMAAVADALALQPEELLSSDRSPRREASPSDEEDGESLRRRLAKAQRDLRNLGAVDYGLLAEYARVDRRYQFLTEQLEDLARTEAGIRESMEEVRERIRAQFMTAFEDVNTRFKASFQELFQGGDADLVLTGEPGSADCAVDVVAQPPGKRLHRLLALSGGERALVGAALLLALIGANPSPFCVLDEVDAALDEINVGRFLHAVRGMASQTQFILVTHNRATMEMADALFGVTMSPGAVSQIIAMRLEAESH